MFEHLTRKQRGHRQPADETDETPEAEPADETTADDQTLADALAAINSDQPDPLPFGDWTTAHWNYGDRTNG